MIFSSTFWNLKPGRKRVKHFTLSKPTNLHITMQIIHCVHTDKEHPLSNSKSKIQSGWVTKFKVFRAVTDDEFWESSSTVKEVFPPECIYELPGRMFVMATVFKLGLCNFDMWLNWFLNLTGRTVLAQDSVCVCVCTHVSGGFFFPKPDSCLTSSCLRGSTGQDRGMFCFTAHAITWIQTQILQTCQCGQCTLSPVHTHTDRYTA